MYFYVYGHILKTTTSKNFKYFRRISFRVFKELWPLATIAAEILAIFMKVSFHIAYFFMISFRYYWHVRTLAHSVNGVLVSRGTKRIARRTFFRNLSLNILLEIWNTFFDLIKIVPFLKKKDFNPYGFVWRHLMTPHKSYFRWKIKNHILSQTPREISWAGSSRSSTNLVLRYLTRVAMELRGRGR